MQLAANTGPTDDARSRVICPGGVGFETRSASGGRGAVLGANLTRPVLPEVSVRVVGIWLGLQFSKPHDKHGNANGDFFAVYASNQTILALSRN